VLAQTCCFRGGFTIDAAEAVLESTRPILEVIESLAEKSLVRKMEGGRLALFGPVRDFAAKHAQNADRTREKHAEYFSARTAKADRAWLAAERENLFAVIGGVLEGGPVTARRAAPALIVLVSALPVLAGVAPQDAFDALIDPVLQATKASGVDALLLSRVLAVRGILRRHRGDARAADDLVRALSVVQRANAPKIEAEILREIGCALADAGHIAEAREHFERAFAKAEGDLALQGTALAAEARLLHRAGDLAQASALLERACILHESDPAMRAEDLCALAAVRIDQGRNPEARSLLRETPRTAAAEELLGLSHLDGGPEELDRARAHLDAAARAFGDLGQARLQGRALGNLGVVAHAEGRAAEAWALFSQALLVETDPEKRATFGAHLAMLDREAGRTALADAALAALPETDVVRVARGEEIDPKNSASVRAALRALRRKSEQTAFDDDTLVIGAKGLWFRAPGQSRASLERRRPLALMLEALGRARIESPGRALDSAQLLAAGWPGEKVIFRAGAHRVRVGIATLRKLGLKSALVTDANGYMLAAEMRVAFA